MSKQQQLPNQQELELGQAVDRFNQCKLAYDDCEHRRMQVVMNGGDSQQYSCEREFEAFKQAFDIQLSLESKMPLPAIVPQPKPK